ncbi:MAG: hypothetical protein V4529_04315 [Gemmatimonadota bacterium]
MRMRSITTVSNSIIALVFLASSAIATAQSSAVDPSARLSAVLPANVAQHVLAVISDARSDNLPSDAVLNRSLKFAARGVAAPDIARAADEQLARMRAAREALRAARSAQPTGDEIEAGAEALREGVSGPDVSRLARSAPSGRSLAVPLYVIGSLVSRGLPSDQALQRVQSKLAARASDADIESSGRDNGVASENHSNEGRGNGVRGGRGGEAETGAAAHGPPAGVPGNAGTHGRESGAAHGKPPTTGKGRP